MIATRDGLKERERELLEELKEVRRLLSGAALAAHLCQVRALVLAGDLEGAKQWVDGDYVTQLLELHS